MKNIFYYVLLKSRRSETHQLGGGGGMCRGVFMYTRARAHSGLRLRALEWSAHGAQCQIAREEREGASSTT